MTDARLQNNGTECPACGGTQGHRHYMTETREMTGLWGETAENNGSNSINQRRSLVECLDCGTKFQHGRMAEKGLV